MANLLFAEHGDSIRILHTLTPACTERSERVGAVMAGANEFDPYKD